MKHDPAVAAILAVLSVSPPASAALHFHGQIAAGGGLGAPPPTADKTFRTETPPTLGVSNANVIARCPSPCAPPPDHGDSVLDQIFGSRPAAASFFLLRPHAPTPAHHPIPIPIPSDDDPVDPRLDDAFSNIIATTTLVGLSGLAWDPTLAIRSDAPPSLPTADSDGTPAADEFRFEVSTLPPPFGRPTGATRTGITSSR